MAVVLVGFSELAEKLGLFVKNNEKLNRHAENRRINSKYRGMKESSFAPDYEKHTYIHGIADVTMESCDHKMFCGRDGSWRAQAADGELPGAAEIDAGSGGCAERADPG